MTWLNLEERENGSLRLSVLRQKSEILTESFLPRHAIEIALKYRGFSESKITRSVLPNRSNKEINSQLKLLGNLAKIQIGLTTHIARHTFRQLLGEAAITDYGVIKRVMGQSRSGDVDDVYYSITDSRRNAK